MAGLRVFISSTCVDLGAQRAQLRAFLHRMGYEPVMSDHSDILYDHRMHTHTACIKEVANADMVILLIGSRFGGSVIPSALPSAGLDSVTKPSSTAAPPQGDEISITQAEILMAIEANIPLFAFVDSKIYSDHHVYQKNKDKDFSESIIYPSVDKPETAKYIFEFINFISHRFSNNAIIPYHNFSDIEDHLLKQWSMTFQRLLREDREKSIENRRSDILLEQIQDVKAAVLQSISAGAGREIAKSVLRFRRLADLLLCLKQLNTSFDLVNFTGTFPELLEEYGIIDVLAAGNTSTTLPRTILIREDGSHLRVRLPDRRFWQFEIDWAAFIHLDRDTKNAVLDGVAATDSSGPPILVHVPFPFKDPVAPAMDVDTGQLLMETPFAEPNPSMWSEERVRQLTELWKAGISASEIAAVVGTSRNAVIGKAHRLGLKARPTPPPSE